MRTRFLPVWFLAVALIGVGWWQSGHDAARAATYYVTNNNDSGPGSLRAAIAAATSGTDEVHIATPGPIQLSTGPITIANTVTIEGPIVPVDPTKNPLTQAPGVTGQVAIVGGGNGSVFNVSSGTVIMSNLFITGGVAGGTTFPAGQGDDAFGGGIYNQGNLTLNYCTIDGNYAVAGNGGTAGGVAYGGGIYSTGTLTLNQSTVSNNYANGGAGANALGTGNGAYGGGIYATGTTNIINSTISGNTAQGGGALSGLYATSNGGLAVGGGMAQSSGTFNLTNSTVYGNQAVGGGGTVLAGTGTGGGVAANNATLNPLNATIAGNSVGGSSTTGGGLAYSNATTLTINNSIVANNSGSTYDVNATPAYNVNGSAIPPNTSTTFDLSPLSDNGGPTLTVASTDSNIVDVGDNTLSSGLSTDQRGAARVVTFNINPAVDAGAVENPVDTNLPPINTPPSVTPFSFSIVDGFASFTSGQFANAVNYPDAGDTLKSVVITSLPTHGYLYLNGEKVLLGSVISVDDLNNLTYQGTDSVPTDSFSWQGSDGKNQLTTIVSETTEVAYDAPPGSIPPGTAGDPTNTVSAPYLSGNTYQGQILETGQTYTISYRAVSTAKPTATSTASQVTVTATGPGVTSDPAVVVNVGTGAAIATTPLHITPTSSGTKHITVTATDINGRSSSYDFYFLADYTPVPTNKSNFVNGDGSPRSFTINLGNPFNQELTASDGDYSVPDYPSIKPEPLKFQVDQVCYGADASTCSTSNTASNIGSFSDSNLSGNLSGGTTLDTMFNWTPTKEGIYSLKVTLTDYWEQGSSFVFTVIVDPPANDPPFITTPSPQSAVVGTAYTLNVVTGDNEHDPLTYTISGLPPGLKETDPVSPSTTVLISGTPTLAGTYPVTLSVKDPSHTTPTTATFTITVKDVGSPVIDNITVNGSPLSSPVNVAANQPFTGMQATAHIDNYPDNLTFTTYDVTDPNNPIEVGGWTNTNTVGTPGTPGKETVTSAFNWSSVPAGIHVVAVRVTADNGQYDERQFTIQAGNAPTLTLNQTSPVNAPIANHGTISVTAGQTLTIAANATDTDNPETLTFSKGSTAPAGLAFAGQTVFNSNSGTAQLSWTPVATDVGSYTFDVIVTDSAGLQGVQTITVNVDPAPPNLPPTVQNPGAQTVNVGDNANIQIVATDPESAPLTYSSTTLPAWASIDASTGLITGTPGAGDVASTPVTINVSDGVNTVSTTFTLTVVQAANAAPTVQNPGTWMLSAGTYGTFSIMASDPESQPLTYTFTNLPSWVVQAPGAAGIILSGTPGVGDVGTTNVTVNVSDGVNTVSVPFEIKVVASGVPTLQATPTAPANPEQVKLGDGYSKIFLATDSDYPETLKFTAVVTNMADNSVVSGASFLPMYESGSASTGTTRAEAFQWTPSAAGTYKVVVTVTDGQGNATSLTFSIHVDSPPSINITPSTLSATPELPLSIPVNVTDGDANETLSLSLGSGAPSGMAFSGSGLFVNVPANITQTAQLNWTPADSDANTTYTFDVTVTDSGGQTATQSVTINVGAVNERPSIDNPGTVTVIKTHEVQIPISATDPEGDPLTYHVSSSPSGLGLTIDSKGIINGTVNGAVGSYQETVTVDDGHHVSPASTMTFTIIVKAAVDNSNPQWLGFPDQTVSVGQNVSIDLKPYVSDPDHDSVTISDPGNTLVASGLGITHDGVLVGTPTTPNIGTYNISLTADDGYGGTSTAEFVLTVEANQPPYSTTLSDYSLYVGDNLYVNASTTDREGDSITYTAAGLPGWASINHTTGIISGVAALPYGSSHVIVTATDTGSGTSTSYPAFTINVLSPFTVGFSNSGDGYATITYTLLNKTNASITPTVTGSLTGAGYTDNTNAFFYASQGLIADQWASPVIQRKLDPTKDTRILTWTLGPLAPGSSATLTISVPIKASTPSTQQLTNQWTAQYGTGTGSVTLNLDPVTTLTGPVPTP